LLTTALWDLTMSLWTKKIDSNFCHQWVTVLIFLKLFQPLIKLIIKHNFKNDGHQLRIVRKPLLTSTFSDYLFKMLIIGNSGVGKSCLLLRYAVSRLFC
jgi:hypothetical protein